MEMERSYHAIVEVNLAAFCPVGNINPDQNIHL